MIHRKRTPYAPDTILILINFAQFIKKIAGKQHLIGKCDFEKESFSKCGKVNGNVCATLYESQFV